MREGSAVLLVDALGRVLLQQRDDPVPPAGIGRWAIPGGGREGDENALETALREFEEETGIGLERLRHFGTFSAPDDPWMRDFRLHLFLAEDDVPRERMVVNEGLDFQYWPRDAIAELPMNPTTRRYLDEVFASPIYGAAIARRATGRRWATVVALDRWGRALAFRPGDTGREGSWSLPGIAVDEGEAPDAAALRGFEAAAGHSLDGLKLFAALRRERELPSGPAPVTHVYYNDPDLALENLAAGAGIDATYVAPDELARTPLADYASAILERFFVSPAYRAMFH